MRAELRSERSGRDTRPARGFLKGADDNQRGGDTDSVDDGTCHTAKDGRGRLSPEQGSSIEATDDTGDAANGTGTKASER